MKKIKTIILLAVILLLSAGTASAGISVSVTPIVDSVSPGETAKYVLDVSLDPAAGLDETVDLSIATPVPDWTYTFSNNGFLISPGQTISVNLDVGVASTTTPNTYIQNGDASTTAFGIQAFETTTYVVTTTAIPEFPTVALPIVSIIGLMLLFQKRKYK